MLKVESNLNPAAIVGFLTGAVVPYLQKRGKARFEGEGDDVVGKWLPLTTGTQNIRESLGFPGAHPINRRTGELEEYIVGSSGMPTVMPGFGAGLEWPGTPPGGELAAKVATAQGGASAAENALNDTPARPVLGINEQDMGAVIVMLTLFLMDQ